MKPDEYVNRFVNLKRIPDEYRSEVELLVKLAYIDGKMHGAERFAETFRRHMLEDDLEPMYPDYVQYPSDLEG